MHSNWIRRPLQIGCNADGFVEFICQGPKTLLYYLSHGFMALGERYHVAFGHYTLPTHSFYRASSELQVGEEQESPFSATPNISYILRIAVLDHVPSPTTLPRRTMQVVKKRVAKQENGIDAIGIMVPAALFVRSGWPLREVHALRKTSSHRQPYKNTTPCCSRPDGTNFLGTTKASTRTTGLGFPEFPGPALRISLFQHARAITPTAAFSPSPTTLATFISHADCVFPHPIWICATQIQHVQLENRVHREAVRFSDRAFFPEGVACFRRRLGSGSLVESVRVQESVVGREQWERDAVRQFRDR